MERILIYADHNATTPMSKSAMAALSDGMAIWGNPSSSHHLGRKAAQAVFEAREQVALQCGVSTDSVVFTSGGSEANSLALLGSFHLNPGPFRLVTTGVEHSSVGDTVKWMQSRGASTLVLAVDSQGRLDLEQFRRVVSSAEPALVSMMAANNETGVVFPIPDVAAVCREFSVALHVDAVQAFGKLPAAHFLDADFISISAHKIFGPKGIGALVIPGGRQLIPTHYGGSQEIKRRGGTENTLGIIGFGAACATLRRLASTPASSLARDRFEATLLAELGGDGGISIQGQTGVRLANTSNVRFKGIQSEILLSAFDLDGLYVSAGSACSSGSISPSHVLIAMGFSPIEARECVRFSWGWGEYETSLEQVDRAAEIVVHHVKRIRSRRKTTS